MWVAVLKEGTHSDGSNLCLTVAGEARTWSVRYTNPTIRKRREIAIAPIVISNSCCM